MKKLTKILLILTVIAIMIGGFYYYRNIFSGDMIRFEINAPENVDAGERMEYMVRYRNNSDTRLEEVHLVFEYPENAIPLDGENDDITRRGEFRREIDIEELNPGEEGVIEFPARLLGRERDSLEASALIRYRPKNLTARYEEERTHTTRIRNVPIAFELGLPSSLKPRSEFTFRLNYSSQIDYALTDLEVRFEHPSNFQFLRSRPGTDAERKDVWPVPVLNEGEESFIEIDGILEGDAGEAKVFQATLGVWRNNKFIPLKETSRGTSISKTNLFVDVLVNGSEKHVASPGEMLRYEIFFKNLGKEALEDLFLMVDFDEKIFDIDKVVSAEGRKSMNSIIWNHTFKPELRSLSRNEEKSVEFWAEVKEDNLPYDPNARIKVSMEQLEFTFINKVNTKLSLDREVVFDNTPFELEKPAFFEEGDTFSYAVKWDIKNHFSNAEDVTIRTVLPQGVEFVEGEDRDDGSFSFRSDSREVVFDLNEFPAGSSESLYFKAEITLPEEVEEDEEEDEEEEEEKEEIKLLSQSEIGGKDKRTGETVNKWTSEVLLEEIL